MKKRSLGFKLVVGGIICVTLPLLLVGLFSVQKATDAISSLARERAVQVASSTARMVDDFLQEEIKIAKEVAAGNATIAATEKVAAEGVAASEPEITNLHRKLSSAMKMIGKDYEAIFVAGADGKVFADGVDGKIDGFDVRDKKYFKDAMSGKPSVVTPVKSQWTGDIVIPVAVPVHSSQGNVVGVLGLFLKEENIIGLVSSMKTGKTGYAWMIDETGLFVAHPKPEYVLTLTLNQLQGVDKLAKAMLSGQTGIETYVFQNFHKTCGFAPVPTTGWSVGATQNTDEFMAAPNYIRNMICIVAGVFLLILIPTVLEFARRIAKPIQGIIEGLNEGSRNVAATAGEVAASSQILAEGSSEQAAAIEQTSSSLEQMTAIVQQNAENAGQTDVLMREANKIVSEASDAMKQLTESMADISTASSQTSAIIKTIDEIAFQTNLLALNAAVEAARAGSAGAGFAVVAEEVRNLAIRSANAAKNSAELIEGTVRKVNAGSEIVDSAFNSFGKIAGATGKVGELVAGIATASKEQAIGIKQITIAISEMDKVTQVNAATAEESAAASEELTSQAEQMKVMVGELVEVVQGEGKPVLSKGESSSAIGEVFSKAKKTAAGFSEKKIKAHTAKSREQSLIADIEDEAFQEF